jgi:hypothetical protein
MVSPWLQRVIGGSILAEQPSTCLWTDVQTSKIRERRQLKVSMSVQARGADYVDG